MGLFTNNLGINVTLILKKRNNRGQFQKGKCYKLNKLYPSLKTVYERHDIKMDDLVSVGIIRTKGKHRLPFQNYYAGTAEGLEKKYRADFIFERMQENAKKKRANELKRIKDEYEKNKRD